MKWQQFYEEKRPEIRDEQLRRMNGERFFLKKKKPETIQNERIQAKYESRKNQCKSCFLPKQSCDCE